MPTILTVDDTAEIRAAVSRMLRGSGIEVLQAETGAEALELLASVAVDLILLDVMMPVMDGPAMLRALRARGDRTPVIMVTSESSRKLIAGAVQCGIADFILKPFRPDALRAKIAKVLGRTSRPDVPVIAGAVDEPLASAVGSSPAIAVPAARRVVDLLLVDDMEQVHRRLRQVLPGHVGMEASADPADAVARCRRTAFRLVLIDQSMPDTDSLELQRQLHALQPQAVFLALCLRTLADVRDELLAAGFADLVYKPFDPDGITSLVHRLFELRGLVEIDGELVTASGCEPRDERIEEHHARLRPALKRAIEQVAAAGHPEAIVDLRQVPLRAERTVRMVMDLDADARRLGLSLRLVATAETASLLARVADTAELDVYETVDRARAAA